MREEIEQLFQASLPGLQLEASVWATLLPLCRVRKLARGATLFAQGQPATALFGVLAGEIEVRFSTMHGALSVVEHVAAGRLFGLAAFAGGRASSYDALATQTTRVAVFGSGAYEFLMDCVPGFARALMREFAQRHDGALRLLEAARHRSAGERLGLALGQLTKAGRAGEVNAEGWYPIRVTQAELAALANLSRQTVNELIAQMVRQQRVRTSYGRLWVRAVKPCA